MFAEENEEDLELELFGDDDEKSEEEEQIEPEPKVGQKRKAAWLDEDDSLLVQDLQGRTMLKKLRVDETEEAVTGQVYQERLQAQFKKISSKNIQWANIEEEEEEEEDEGNIVGTKHLIKKSSALSPTSIIVARMKDLTLNSPHKGQVTAVEFHPDGKLALTAGMDKTLKIWTVDGHDNILVSSVYLKDMPIYCAHFTADGQEVVLSGRRKFFYIYNLRSQRVVKIPCIKGRKERSFEYFIVSPDNKYIIFTGMHGHIILVSRQSKKIVRTLKINGQVRKLDITKDGKLLTSIGTDGEIYFWNLETFQCSRKFKDANEWNGTAVSMDGRRVVTGCENGIVNLYHRGETTPYKSLSNLTTGITEVLINHDSQLLVCYSKLKKDALRLVHLESGAVFPNWPYKSTPLNYVNHVTFSPNSGFMAVANARGIVMLYRLKQFNEI